MLRFIQNCFNFRVASANATVKRAFADTDLGKPLHHILCTPLNRDTAIATPVIVLFGSCSPTAVLRTVIAVIINAFKRVQLTWTNTHISEEESEVAPFRADLTA